MISRFVNREEPMPTAVSVRNFASPQYLLEVAGIPLGIIDSLEGGDAVGTIVEEKPAAGHFVKKHIPGLTYEDIVLTCGADMSSDFFGQLKRVLGGDFSPKNGSIKTFDYNLRPISQLDFMEALITEIGFPALDAASKDLAKLTIKITPEYTRTQTTTGAANVSAKSKRWLASNFILKIPGLDCTHVAQIDALTVQVKNSPGAVGEKRTYDAGTYLDVSNLVVRMPERSSQTFRDWHNEFVVKANNGPDKEKVGTLTFLTEDLKGTLFVLNFIGLGIFRCARVQPSSPEQVAYTQAEMYCDSVSLG
jgi:hypothetical protein